MAELTTISAVKPFLGITSGTTYDTVLVGILEGVEMAMRSRYNRPDGWTQAVFTETFDGESANRLVVKNAPVDTTYSSQSVSIDGNVISSSLYTVNAAEGVFGFKLDAFARLAWGTSSMRILPNVNRTPNPNMGTGFQSVSVTYRGGYTAIPENLATAAAIMCSHIFNTRKFVGVQSQTLGQHSYTLAMGALADTWATVDLMVAGQNRRVLV